MLLTLIRSRLQGRELKPFSCASSRSVPAFMILVNLKLEIQKQLCSLSFVEYVSA